MLYHGPVRVPSRARAGSAKVIVEFPEKSVFRSFPTTIPVEIVTSGSPG